MDIIETLKEKLNAPDVIKPPVPNDRFWTDPVHFNLQPDELKNTTGLEYIGRMPSKKSVDVTDSILGVGFETLDRDTFDPIKTVPFLAHSGVKRARCQTGWMKCEKVVGQYDFKWLDDVVDSLGEVGIETWFSLSFGHPVHTPCEKYAKAWQDANGKLVPGWARGWVGETPFYHGKDAMNAWKKYVTALCEHFKGRVAIFEVWNEPEWFWVHNGEHLDRDNYAQKAKDYTEFVKITADTVRAVIPEARIVADVAQTATAYLKALGNTGLADIIDIFSYHFYGPVPEEYMHQRFENIKAVLVPSDPDKTIEIWQGESGRASGKSALFAFPTEYSQARYLTRRYTIDLACGAKLSSFFTVTDFICYYQDGSDQYYGVINARNNCGKLGYYAMQAMGFLFDGLKPAPDLFCALRNPVNNMFKSYLPYNVEAYAMRRNGVPVFAMWIPEHVEISAETVRGTIHLLVGDDDTFDNPIVIDPIRRNVWRFKPDYLTIQRDGGNFFGAKKADNFPVIDYPLFITDASILL